MYVIFPADEVVYLSYGRVIYVPTTNNSGQIINSGANNNHNNKETSSSHQSIRSHTSAPSLPSTSTGSSRSTIQSSIGTSHQNGYQSDNNSDKGKLKRNKSKSSKDSKDSEEKPVRPQRYKKVKETVNVSELKKDQYLRVPTNSVNNTKLQQQQQQPPQQETSTARRLSYSDFLPHQRLNVSPKRDKVTKKEVKRNSSGVNFDELFNAQLSNSASSLPRLQQTESFYSTTGERNRTFFVC